MSAVDTLKEMAVTWGCPRDQVDHLWDQHVAYCDTNGIESYGGMLWRSLIDKAKGQDFIPIAPSAGRVKAERLAEASRIRARDAEAYERASETFGAFLTRMRAAKERGESVGPHIEALLARSDELSGSVSLVEIMADVVKKRPE